MDKQNNNGYTVTSKEIAMVREQFMADYEANPELYDAEDLVKVNTDHWVSRFIGFLDQGPEKGLDHMVECFRWRKTFGVNAFDQAIIPLEVYQMGPLFIYEPDNNGRLNLFIRGKMHRKIEILEERLKRSFVNYVEKVDAAANKQFGWNLVLDCQGAGLSNADLDMLVFMMMTVRKYYPNGVKYVYVCGLPWILNSVAKVVLAFMPSDTAKKIRFVSHDELHQRVATENLPDFMGGTCKKNYRIIPKGVKPCEQLGRELYNLTEEQVKKVMAPSMKYIKEGEKTAIVEC
ncbi:Motile sperm domain-containing protein 2 [Halotydeus destructor]|nr:Motile sperm domain-containing protein 2 [Halotydeus destructor]